MTTKYLKNSSGDIIEGTTVSTSAGSGSADKIPSLDASGLLDVSMLPGMPVAVTNDTGVTTTLATLFTIALPTAGRYRVRLQVRFRGLSGTGFQTITLSGAHASLTELLGSWTRSKRNQTVDTGAIYGGTTFVSSRGAAIGDVHAVEFLGHIIVSASGSLTISTQLDAGTGNVLPGSVAQVIPESSSTTLQGYANYVTITSGSGYAGSVLTSTNAGQWKADGTNISGQTGSTYTVTRDVEGKAITCGTSSNAIQMWTPLHLPSVYQTDGTNYGGWWDPGYSSTVTLNSGNISSLANLFSGGPAMTQATSAAQPAYNVGGYIDFPATANAPNATYGLLPASAICLKYFCVVIQYSQGTQTSFAGYNGILNDSTANSHSISGNANNGGILSPTYINSSANIPQIMAGEATVNGASSIRTALLPMPLSLLEFRPSRGAVTVGPYCAAAANCWRGPYREFMTLAAVPANSIAEKIQGYMMWHNAIQTSLPPDHPYYASPPRVS